MLGHGIENTDLLSACSNAGLNCPSSKPPGIMKWWKKIVAELVCWQEAVLTENFLWAVAFLMRLLIV